VTINQPLKASQEKSEKQTNIKRKGRLKPGDFVTKLPNARPQKSVLSIYLKEISAYSLLLPEEEISLGRLAQQGDEAAVQRLVEANLRFVVKIAKRYQGLRLSLLDLIHEGNLGLIHAAKRFDPTRQVRFLTYAVWWIRQSVLCAVSNYSHPFRVPPKISSNLYRMNAVLAKQSESGVQPTVEELAAECGLTATEIEVATQLKQETVSLDRPLYPYGNRSLEDVLPDITQSSPEQRLMDYDLKRHLKSVVERLTSREQQVISLRFGLDGEEPKTLGEIGAQIGVCRERVRQIQVNAVNKLRNNDEIRTIAVAFA
jgi:RNA polymerase primary sigma factor